MMRSTGLHRCIVMVATCLLGISCGPRVSLEDIERSMREYQLAVGLREEGNQPGAREHVNLALELDPKNAEATLFLAYLNLERQDLDAAERGLRQGIAMLVEQNRLASTLAEARNLLGVVLIERGEYDEAVETLRLSAADAMNTSPHLAWGNLGLALMRQGHNEEAMAAFERSIQNQPRFCIGYARMGELFFQQSNFERAEETLTQALESDPSCRTHAQLQYVWRIRGESRARLGHRGDALSDFEHCVELGPRTSDGLRCQAFLDGAN